MMKLLAITALLSGSVATMASAQNDGAYDYSQPLDIAKVIEVEAIPSTIKPCPQTRKAPAVARA
ncbi:DUF2790 domain-containing protein [Pseudomonas sp. KK4]|uniref:DUF2790 domain-containing protein n=1 Tax=Pseudomonas sp. KK4 TaxID=1855729 RepID=UPI0011157A32|nr:DUF2790 domain-containing protein [Pseudomonas sp. KK4]